jgi:gliding motility-associated lipoprotein GldH
MKPIQIKARLFLILFLFSILFFSSCDNSRIFEKNTAIPEVGWSSKNVIKFDVDIANPNAPTNFYVNVRNAAGYPYSNLFLFIKTTFPNGKMSKDTLECILANDKGKWLGSGMGDIFDNQIPFKRNVRFPQEGKYTFEIQHGMRMDTIPLIMDVGLRIEKSK